MKIVELQNETIKVKILSYGATISHFEIKNSTGDWINVLLGFEDPLDYEKEAEKAGYPYFGAFVGRSCNRTHIGEFTVNGKRESLAINNGPNSLHGGINGFHKKCFTCIASSERSATFQLISPHREEGYPGSIKVTLIYTLDGNGLALDSTAELLCIPGEDVEETYVNFTSHPYFNLSGGKDDSIHDHLVDMTHGVSGCLELDDNQIPTGRVLDRSSNPELFLDNKPLKDSLHLVQNFKGYDHFYLTPSPTAVMKVTCPANGLSLKVTSDATGFQFYTGNWLDGSFGYGQYAGFCVEPSHPPNSINMTAYRDLVLLKKGHPKKQRIVYQLIL
jgi:aldose 1-epimerase